MTENILRKGLKLKWLVCQSDKDNKILASEL